jgi:hypothetical protein
MKNLTNIHDLKNLILTVFAIFACASLASAQETLAGGYAFGPGTNQQVRDDVRINLPAGTDVTFLVQLQRSLSDSTGRRIPLDVPVVVEVIAPDGRELIEREASATVVSAGIPIPVIPIVGTFKSQAGCPGFWTVRVRTRNNLAPPVRIFGSVTFGFVRPGPVNLDVEGDIAMNAGASATRTLMGRPLIGSPSTEVIAGTGTFRIRAKWHTDPLDLNPLHFGNYFRARVDLLRPNGTVAASETGFSRHAPADRTPKIDFSYTVTQGDTALTGAWRIRVSNLSGNPRIVGFDVEKGLVDPLAPTLANFNSTFTAGCGTPPAIS